MNLRQTRTVLAPAASSTVRALLLTGFLSALVLPLGGCPSDSAAPSAAATPATTPATAPATTPATNSATATQAEAPPSAPVSEDAPPPVVLEPEVMDFGTVAPGVIPEAVVKLRNTSDKPLTILAVQPSCKCTTVDDLVGQEIPAGGSVELKASMKKDSSPGQKKADIKVLVDGYSRVIPVQLRMEVSLPVRVVPGYVNAVRDQPKSGRLVVESLDKQPFTICSVGGKPPNLIGFDAAKDPPRNQYVLSYDIARDFGGEPVPLFWVLETDRADCPLVDIRMRLESTMPKPTFKMQDYRITFGRVEQGKSADFTVQIAEQPDDEPILSASLDGERGRVELVNVEKDGMMTNLTLRFTPAETGDGLVWAPLKIHSNRRTQEAFLWGQVVPAGHQGCLGR